jgi:hypothetical protein
MKRSRRVVLTVMGSAAIGAVSMGFGPRRCGPNAIAVRTSDGRLACRTNGFGGTLRGVYGHGRGHAGG